ncbi:hypothetical protein K469DRAFT_564970 [Zopfia rhizophila CBS 207.26]|uniref:Uncharacterized protein n=1 Tax=Zopfia rhizophila CBS 207.26 TaxID=1314779 RepID=A0A6A6EEF8_9PEZI|nr:hypothetical protein K469DRAFT_564970 [Zopfia rhizophila CBS 207.26]
MAPLFPFVAIPPDVTPDQLWHEKPVLYMSIMMVACQSDIHRQLNLARMVRYEISQAVLVRGEKSLELLEGLLVYLAWNHVHLQLGSQLYNLLHIAVAMLTELGLNKEPYAWSKTAAGALREFGRDRRAGVTRTLEERRALLGVFWMSSITKTCFKDIEAVRFTRYTDKCCRILEEAMENPTDIYLVRLVRLQQKADRIGEILYTEELDTVSGMSAPLAMDISSLESEVLEIGRALPLEIPQAALLLISYNTLRLYLYKIALDDQLFLTSSISTESTFPSTTYTIFRNNLLASCLATIKSMVSLFFALPTRIIFSLPYPTWGQIGHAMLILSRLSEVKHDTWDPAYVSSELDIRETLKALARRLEEVMTIGIGEIPARRLSEIFTHMVSRLRELSETVGRSSEDEILGGGDIFLEEEIMNGMLFGFFDIGQVV